MSGSFNANLQIEAKRWIHFAHPARPHDLVCQKKFFNVLFCSSGFLSIKANAKRKTMDFLFESMNER